MPKTVDHTLRRRDVTAVAAELVADRGRSALTVRNVASAAGYSTTVVSHYFDDVSDLLHEVYEFAASRARRRIDAVLVNDPTDIEGLIEAVLPLDLERQQDWQIWFAFWSEAIAVPAFAADQRERARTTTKRLRTCLKLLQNAERLPATVDLTRAADRLSTLIPGLAADATFDPKRWTARRQRRVVRDELRSLGLDGVDPLTLPIAPTSVQRSAAAAVARPSRMRSRPKSNSAPKS